MPSDAELERRILEYDRASELTGPLGSLAAAVVFALVAGELVPPGRLLPWFLVVLVGVAGMGTGMVLRRRDAVGLPGFALTGIAWGVLPLVLSTDGRLEDRSLWAVFAFQFAMTAGVLSGSNVDDRPGRLVVLTMWAASAVSFVVVGRPLVALAGVVFAALVDRDLRNTSTMVRELMELRSSAAARARDAARAALRDPLTGLLNRSGLEHSLGEGGPFGAAMFVDLDRFKDVNDLHGHRGGDQVLVAVAGRLRGIFRDRDLVARVGGDEFVIVLHGAHDRDVLMERAAEVIDVLEDPVAFEDATVLCSASVGVAPIEGTTVDVDRVLSESDHAMYDAKRSGRRRAVLFGESGRAELDDHAELSNALRAAVRDGELDVWGQPVVVAHDRSVFGVELLARWPMADGSFVPPSRFIPVAEEIGVASDIARMVLRRAVHAVVDWEGHPVFGDAKVGFNVSGLDLRGDWLVDEVRAVTGAAGVDPSRLVVEITESSSLHDDPETRRCLDGLHELGVLVALDDFGTGYSSITSLLELPIDVVKLDRTLTVAAERRARDDEAWPDHGDVIAAIGALASAIGRYVLAEGVETEAEASALVALGFPFAQGNLFCPPLPLHELGRREGLAATPAASVEALEGNSTARPRPQ